MKFAITTKIGMSRVFDEEGKKVAVTLLSAKNGTVSRIKSADSKDGYNAVVVEVKPEKEGKKSKYYEFRADNIQDYKVGDKIDASSFSNQDTVIVSSVSKGKGFAGTIKRHGFHRGPVSHGSHNVRQPGSIGGGYPQRVVAGKKMPGRMGGINAVTKNLKIMHIDTSENIIAVSGSVPGASKSTVRVVSK